MRDTVGSQAFRVVVLVLLALFTIAPIYVMVSSSIKPLQDVQEKFTWVPTEITFQPYIDMWTTVPLANYFLNTLIVASVATVVSVIIAIFASFAVSRFRFRGRRVFAMTVLSTQMFPGILFLLPLFLIFLTIDRTLSLQLLGTHAGLIVTYLTFCLPFSVWMLAGYFDGIPHELDEAARVDGCTHVGALIRVILPAAVPGVVAVAIFSFMTAWGEVLFASVMTSEATRTLGVGLQQYSTQTDVYWNQIMAASLVVSVPVVVGFLLLQRFFVAGLATGAVK